ncbi:hypothetical protein JTB14_024213 [Gonioctena quinquepunctata]|nr:hypothetical protein JTB14_024213 [Gonioctena quinquepunctata]
MKQVQMYEEKKSEEKLEIENVNPNKNLTRGEKIELFELLTEFQDCFAMNLSELGVTTGYQYKITTKSHEPITYRPHRLNYLDKKYKKWLKNWKVWE